MWVGGPSHLKKSGTGAWVQITMENEELQVSTKEYDDYGCPRSTLFMCIHMHVSACMDSNALRNASVQMLSVVTCAFAPHIRTT